MTTRTGVATLSAATMRWAAIGSTQAQATGMDRTLLPIAEPDHPRATELDARNAKAPPRFEVRGEGTPTRTERDRVPDRRHRLRAYQRLWRRHSDAYARPAGQPRAARQPLPHHRALLAHPRGPP